MVGGFVFDLAHYDALNAAREPVISSCIESIREEYELRTSLDIGCGVGHFSALLHRLNFEVLALDGRQENVLEAQRREPKLQFAIGNAEDAALLNLGKFDLVLCLGLYYHLENPFLAFRNLLAVTGKAIFMEGMCVPGDAPVLAVREEGPTEDQGLRHVALYPTQNGLVKLLYRAGFPYVYRPKAMPQHPDYRASSLRRQVRTMVIAATQPLSSTLLQLEPEPSMVLDPWTVRNSPAAIAVRTQNLLLRLARFAQKPWAEKQKSLQRRWSGLFSSR